MSTVQIPDYTTDPFFGLEDKWIETAEGELTHIMKWVKVHLFYFYTVQVQAYRLLQTGG